LNNENSRKLLPLLYSGLDSYILERDCERIVSLSFFHNFHQKREKTSYQFLHNLQQILLKLKPQNKVRNNTASQNKVLSIISIDRMVNNTVYSNTPRAHSNQIHGAGPIILITFLALLNIVFSIIRLYLILRFLRSRLTVNNIESREWQHPSLVDNLPLIVFFSVSLHRSVASDHAECTMCVSKFEENDILRLLPLCCHAFHAECVDKWLCSNSFCPLCRASVLLSEADLVEILRSPSENKGTDANFVCEEHSISISNYEDTATLENSPVTQESDVAACREDWRNEMVEKLAAKFLFDNGICGERLDGFQAC